MKQFAQGLIKIRENIDNKKTHFLGHDKGDPDIKSTFLAKVDQLDLGKLKAYVTDERVYGELEDKEQSDRSTFEMGLAEQLENLFSDYIHYSAGGILVTREEGVGYEQIDFKIENMVNSVKREGGGKIQLSPVISDI